MACDKSSTGGAAPSATTTPKAPPLVLSVTPRTPEKPEQLMVGAKAFEFPTADLPLPVPADVQQDDGRITYKTSGGKQRVLYIVGERLLVGELYDTVDWSKVPPFAAARRAIYERGAREAVLAATKEAQGETALASLLFDVADLPDTGEWQTAASGLGPEGRAALVKQLAPIVTNKGAPASKLGRAVLWVDLSAQAGSLHARLEELLAVSPMPDTRALAIMLRALLKEQAKEAAALGCSALTKFPKDSLAHDPLAATAALAIYHAQGTCPALAQFIEGDPCASALRCGPNGPVSPRDASAQDEPLCSKEQVDAAKLKELGRAPTDLMKEGYTPGAAFAWAALGDAVPEGAKRAQARRLYKITQGKSPRCDAPETKEGASCNCNEAILRATACRAAAPSGGAVTKASDGTCALVIDDAKKSIDKVTATRTPITY
jgi:hypothetical protein